MNNFYKEVTKERDYQKQKWGEQSTHSVFLWLSILMEEVGEAAEVLNEGRNKEALSKELIRVAAVAEAWYEKLNTKPKPLTKICVQK